MTASDFQNLFKVIARHTDFDDEVKCIQTEGVVIMKSGKYFRVELDGICMKPSWRSSKVTKVSWQANSHIRTRHNQGVNERKCTMSNKSVQVTFSESEV